MTSQKKTVYIKNIGYVVIPSRNTQEEILHIVEKLKDHPKFIKDWLEILPESLINKKTVYIKNVGYVVIPPRNTKEEILLIVEKLKYYPEFIKNWLEILPESEEDKIYNQKNDLITYFSF